MARPIEQRGTWRMLRRLLPARYRAQYGAELLQTHVDAAGGSDRARGARFTLRLAGDVVITAVQVRLDQLRGDGVDAQWRGNTGGYVDAAWHNTTMALRSIRRDPFFAVAIVATLTFAIAANVTVLRVADRLLLSGPERIAEPEAVRQLFTYGPRTFSPEPIHMGVHSYRDYVDYAALPAFEAVAAVAAYPMTLGSGGNSREVLVEQATSSYFPLLGVQPAVGRFYQSEEATAFAAEPAAVISHGFWQRHFGGRADAIGTRLQLGKGHYTVVGVAPAGFTGVDLAPVDVWVPLESAQQQQAQGGSTDWSTKRDWFTLRVIARLLDADAVAVAEEQATATFQASGPRNGGARDVRVVLTPLVAALGPEPPAEARIVKMLVPVALLVLLIGCANAANLQLARGLQRYRTYAVQSALGIGSGRLVAQVATEALLLALLAGGCAWLLSVALGPAAFAIMLPDAALPQLDSLRVAGMSVGLSLLSGLLAGIYPALRVTRGGDVAHMLRRGGGVTQAKRFRRVLLAAQAAMTVMLLAGSGLFLRSLHGAIHADMGMDTEAVVLEMELNSGERFNDAMEPVALALREKLAAHPGVANAAATSLAPFDSYWGSPVALPNGDSLNVDVNGPFYFSVSDRFFDALALRFVSGRAIDAADLVAGARPIAVVNQAFARAAWPGRSAIGECFRPGFEDAPCTEVVGVVADMRPYLFTERRPKMFYLPLGHPAARPARAVVVRTYADPRPMLQDLREIARSASPDVRYVQAQVLANALEPQLRPWRLGAALLTTFGALALIVAAAGLYSVLSFDVAQRRFELGVRAALGARGRDLIGDVVGRVLVVTAIGAAAGIAIAAGAGRFVESMLFDVSATDPLVYAGVTLAMLLVAVTSAALPALRVARTNAIIALQQPD